MIVVGEILHLQASFQGDLGLDNGALDAILSQINKKIGDRFHFQ